MGQGYALLHTEMLIAVTYTDFIIITIIIILTSSFSPSSSSSLTLSS
jgi:hypothetical protein